VAKLVDAYGLGPYGETLGGSSPLLGTLRCATLTQCKRSKSNSTSEDEKFMVSEVEPSPLLGTVLKKYHM
jgi:hypothetical protein